MGLVWFLREPDFTYASNNHYVKLVQYAIKMELRHGKHSTPFSAMENHYGTE